MAATRCGMMPTALAASLSVGGPASSTPPASNHLHLAATVLSGLSCATKSQLLRVRPRPLCYIVCVCPTRMWKFAQGHCDLGYRGDCDLAGWVRIQGTLSAITPVYFNSG